MSEDVVPEQNRWGIGVLAQKLAAEGFSVLVIARRRQNAVDRRDANLHVREMELGSHEPVPKFQEIYENKGRRRNVWSCARNF